jgi:16S rRNA (cytidine1402-2'-O)-methyltransferase
VAVCRELTKRHEEIARGSARELAGRFAEPPKGEVTLVLGPAAGVEPAAPSAAVEAVAELVGAGVARRQAASVVARLTGLSRKDLYDTSL